MHPRGRCAGNRHHSGLSSSKARKAQAFRAFFIQACDLMRMTRDWWAVLLAAAAAVLVKLGVVQGVPW